MNPDDPNQNPTQPTTPPTADQPVSEGAQPVSEPPQGVVEEKCVTCGGTSSGGNCVPCGQVQVSCTCPSAQPPVGEQSGPTQPVV